MRRGCTKVSDGAEPAASSPPGLRITAGPCEPARPWDSLPRPRLKPLPLPPKTSCRSSMCVCFCSQTVSRLGGGGGGEPPKTGHPIPEVSPVCKNKQVIGLGVPELLFFKPGIVLLGVVVAPPLFPAWYRYHLFSISFLPLLIQLCPSGGFVEVWGPPSPLPRREGG
jgi:hypothetical protein